MNKSTVNQTIEETTAIASRRKFLQQLAYGSLLAMGSSSIANAAKKHTAIKQTAHVAKAKTTANHHVNHAATKIHANKHEAAHHLAKHETAKHTSRHHELITAHNNHHSHHSAVHHQTHHSVAEYTPAPAPRIAPLQSIARYTPHKTLVLKNAHTGDGMEVTYFENGRYIEDALKEIDYLYQDHLTGDIYPVDPSLLDQLHDVKQLIGTSQPIHIVCGYRSPLTNAYLRRQSGAVARNSLHMQGRAVDIRIEGVDTRTIRNAALAMGQGGVGYYPHANFVHLDTGDVRTW